MSDHPLNVTHDYRRLVDKMLNRAQVSVTDENKRRAVLAAKVSKMIMPNFKGFSFDENLDYYILRARKYHHDPENPEPDEEILSDEEERRFNNYEKRISQIPE